MQKLLLPKGLTEIGFKQLKLAHKNMLARCYYMDHHARHNYGGRGITVCALWRESRAAFIAWAIANGFAEGLTLDRENSNGNYEPNNCRWVTRHAQLSNQRRNRIITYKGKTQTMAQWANELGLSFATLWRRLDRCLPLDIALTPRLLYAGATKKEKI